MLGHNCIPDKGSRHLLRVAHIVAYRDIFYPRNGSIVRALEQSPDIIPFIAHNRSANWRRYIETWQSLVKIQRETKPDIYLFGFRSHEIFWLLLFNLKKKPIVFDALMSPYASLSEEHKMGWWGRLLAPTVFFLERSILRRADLILTDTPSHIAYYQQTFGLPAEKFCALPVSAPEVEQHAPQPSKQNGPFSVLFFGSFLPLHGINTIIQAATLLRQLPIRFDFVGGSAKQLLIACTAAGIKHYTHREWVPFDELLSREIPRAHLCLGGPFGNTQQARRVITTKTAQCLAAGRATVVGRIDSNIGFVDKYNCLLVNQADPNALANAILWAFEHEDSLAKIGEKGQQFYKTHLSVRVVADRLTPRLHALTAKKQR